MTTRELSALEIYRKTEEHLKFTSKGSLLSIEYELKKFLEWHQPINKPQERAFKILSITVGPDFSGLFVDIALIKESDAYQTTMLISFGSLYTTEKFLERFVDAKQVKSEDIAAFDAEYAEKSAQYNVR